MTIEDEDKRRPHLRQRSNAEHTATRATPAKGHAIAPAPPVPASIAAQIAPPAVWGEELTQPGEPAEVTLARRELRPQPGEPPEVTNARRLERASIATTLTLQRMDKQDSELAALKTGHVELGKGLHRVEKAQIATTAELQTLVKLATAADRAREQEAISKATEKAAKDAIALAEVTAAAERAAAIEARRDARADKAQDQKFELSKLSLGRQVALVGAILTGIAGVIAAIAQYIHGVVKS